MSSMDATTLSAALDRMWAKFLPEMLERIAVLEQAGDGCAAGRLAPAQVEAAASAAHKLAGVLGTFGLAQGTALARELERLYSAPRMPAKSQSARLRALAAQLRAMVESRH